MSWHERSLAIAALAVTMLSGSAQAQRTHLLVVSGLAGEPRFTTSFSQWTDALVQAARTEWGVAPADLTVLSENGRDAARSTRENVLRAVARLGERVQSADQLVIVLFGHGSEDAGEASIALPGPDLSAQELAAALSAVSARRTIIVSTGSASGGFLAPLAGKGRIVITATRSAAENNETLFPVHFVAALTDNRADTDKDGRVSILEAFEYTRREVARAYESTQRLPTEHALLDADGDGVGTTAPRAESGDGAVVALAFFAPGGRPAAAPAAAAAAATPELRVLYQEKTRLEEALATLRAQRAQLPDNEYQQQLERLLLELSRNGQAIRRLEGGSQ